MSKALIYSIFCLALAGCLSTGPVEVVDKTSPVEVVAYSSLQEWMNQQEETAKLNPEQAASELATLEPPVQNGERFRYGLLNQQLKTFNGWTLARDTFRDLQRDEHITPEQRQLVSILEHYNQSRINWYEIYSELQTDYKLLQEQLQASTEEKSLLEKKIKELTDIEAVINTRKEQ